MDQLQVTLILVVVAVVTHQTHSETIPSLNQVLPGCNSTCGDIQIPYPFGIGNSSTPDQKPCFLDPMFSLTCNNSTLLWGNLKVLNISVPAHQLDISFYVSMFCNDSMTDNEPWMSTADFSISMTENKFLSVGYNSVGYLLSVYNNKQYGTGCVTATYDNKLPTDYGTCSGIGCCQVDIPPLMRNITIQTTTIPNLTQNSGKYCSYSFVVKDGSYYFNHSHLRTFPYEMLPLVLDWTAGKENCAKSSSGVDYACRDNSHCNDTNTDYGYRCICNYGYEGNPYIGCTDIDECKTENHGCITENNCQNTDGSHYCFCPKGQSGNGTKTIGCHQQDAVIKVVIGVGVAIVILLVATTSLYIIYQRRKLVKLKEKYFQKNGGSILLQKLYAGGNSSHITQIFTEEELQKATNNFDESLIIGRGGFGTVFKGYLADNRVVAVKKSKIVDESQKEQFINEVIVLSQINHRNVVKLLGCCLEREVPLLVYEFVNNGTLFDMIHNDRKVHNESWKTRLRIAAEAAGALSYLHSDASIPIIHRDVKTANILLDNTYTAKVSDFGASRLVPLDQTEIATIVQGTFGYLDPEYMLTSQLTEKSDVYSFGVVLLELLTGEKPYSCSKPEEKRSLTNHFLSCLKKENLSDILQVGISNEENSEIIEVAILAEKCLRLKGEERPSMKEAAMELDAIRKVEKHPWIYTSSQNLEETQSLLHEAAYDTREHGDSSGRQNRYDSLRDLELIEFGDGR